MNASIPTFIGRAWGCMVAKPSSPRKRERERERERGRKEVAPVSVRRPQEERRGCPDTGAVGGSRGGGGGGGGRRMWHARKRRWMQPPPPCMCVGVQGGASCDSGFGWYGASHNAPFMTDITGGAE